MSRDYSIKDVAKMAKTALQDIDVGNQYTVSYVNNRLEAAINESPHDAVIRGVSSVIKKMASTGKLITNQKEIYEAYNKFSGPSRSDFRDLLGDLLYKKAEATVKSNDDQSFYRASGPDVSLTIDHNPLENLFSQTKSLSGYFDSSLAKVGMKKLSDYLKDINMMPAKLDIFAGNDAAILYNAKYVNKSGEINVAIPLEIKNGSILDPDTFIQSGNFTELNIENLSKYINKNAKQSAGSGGAVPDVVRLPDHAAINIKTTSNMMNSNFTFDNNTASAIGQDSVKLPEALKNIMSYETSLINASSNFPVEIVKTAQSMCVTELSNLGFKSQVKLHSSDDNYIVCEAQLDSPVGRIAVKLPVEVMNNKPQFPSVFYAQEDKIYDLNKAELTSFLISNASNENIVSRYPNDMSFMTYEQLKDLIIDGAVSKNYKKAEFALNIIEDKFGADFHKTAIADYAKYLSTASIPKKEHKCKLLVTKGTLIPRCGHYNVSIERISYDEYGNCTLKERQAKYDNLAASGTSINTSKIKLT